MNDERTVYIVRYHDKGDTNARIHSLWTTFAQAVKVAESLTR